MAFTDQTFEAHMGYAPWLRALVDDMSLAYLSGTRKLNKRQAVGMALRYFSLGNITFTDVNGTAIRDFSPNEFSLDFEFLREVRRQVQWRLHGALHPLQPHRGHQHPRGGQPSGTLGGG